MISVPYQYQRKIQRTDTDGSWITFNAEHRQPACRVKLYNHELGLYGQIDGTRFEELRLQQEAARQDAGHARPAVFAIPLTEVTLLPAT
jgi:hypothetical protein